MAGKINFADAVAMEKTGAYHLIHIEWMASRFPYLEERNPDCSHMLVQTHKHWSDPSTHTALVLTDDDAEEEWSKNKWDLDMSGKNWKPNWCDRLQTGELTKNEE